MSDSITAKELKKLIPQANIIDIRENYKFNIGSIPTSVNIPATFLIMNADHYLNKNDKYYIYCDSGYQSKNICNKLINMGYKAINIIGGYNEYKNLKY